ncbi:TetR/AcrR family transcriptional regulator [Dactylosporangium sp. NPDC051541]|uniref:TetR/AcrR family transcriptional regulator n=1 Tax=Dactylosporangium sp. NPDC051541 TaxID=3363977 RepID=UPI0037AD3B4C
MSLREIKRARTRQAIVAAATDLFERDGYEQTTIADIAAAAEIGTRTFFGYFASKEDLLFPETDARLRAAVQAVEQRAPGDRPAEVLLRALSLVGEDSDDLSGRLAALRLRFIAEIPSVRGRALQTQMDMQQELARRLAAAYPDELDPIVAAALVGAFVGAVTGALHALLGESGPEDADRDPAVVQKAVEHATSVALRPWIAHDVRQNGDPDV